MNEISVRHDIDSLVRLKNNYLIYIEKLDVIDNSFSATMKEINSFPPYRLTYDFKNYGKGNEIKYIDQQIWYYLTMLFELQKYMLCTDYEKLLKDIDNFNFPEFTKQNAEGWLAGLKGVIHENIKNNDQKCL